MKRLSDGEYLRRSLERAYHFVDVFDQIWAEKKAAGQVTVEDMVAASDVRQTLNNLVQYYHRELRILARHGGHGHRVQGAAAARRKAEPCVPGGTESSAC